MTDRHAAYVVVLDEEVREDQAEGILTALRMVKGVTSVRPVTSNVTLQIAEEQAVSRLRGKVLDAVYGALDMRPRR